MLGRCRRLVLALLGALAVPALLADSAAAACTMPPKPSGLRAASVVRVVDGDTIVARTAEDQSLRVRLIGVDTPEVNASDKLHGDAARSGRDIAAIRALGARASEFTKRQLGGRRIELEGDVAAIDRHGRTLAHVWVGEQLYNLIVVREGYAGVLTIPPNVKYAGVLVACHREARQKRRGLWALDDIAAGER